MAKIKKALLKIILTAGLQTCRISGIIFIKELSNYSASRQIKLISVRSAHLLKIKAIWGVVLQMQSPELWNSLKK